MLEREVIVINKLGLHARAAAKLVRLSKEFSATITITRVDSGVSADARSILNVLYVGAPYGSKVRIVTEGDDEEAAMLAIEGLFGSGFGEN